MFAPEQIVRVFSVSLIHLLIVVYMNFKNIRRTNKENILLFTLLFISNYIICGFIQIPGIRFSVVLAAFALLTNLIYQLNFVESFALSLISVLITVLGDFVLLFFFVNFLKLDYFNLDHPFYMCIANLSFLFITILAIIIKQLIQQKKYKSKISTKFFFLSSIVFIVIICTLNLYFNKQIISTNPTLVIIFNLIAFAVYFFVCLFLVLSYFALNRQALLMEQQAKEYEQLIEYTQIIESLYQDIRNQKHDFFNVLFSLKCYIDNGKLDELSSYYYNSVLKEYRESPQNHILSSLNYIKQTGLKGILSYKLNQAISMGLKVYINIFSEIWFKDMDIIDLCKVAGILIDNAIEASSESLMKELHVGIETGDGSTSIIIANTYLNEPNISQLFKRGVSTKGKNRGLGLCNVKNILSQYPSVFLKTTVDYNLFFQELVFTGSN
ncbi:MAG: GHKL domain-containing protein [Clostridiaceae bacterium]|nr:GHKL domain-containing protein [Clostridiaceae bacterium]